MEDDAEAILKRTDMTAPHRVDPLEQAEMLGGFAAEAMRGEFPPFGPTRGHPDEAYSVAREAAHWGRIHLRPSRAVCHHCGTPLSEREELDSRVSGIALRDGSRTTIGVCERCRGAV
jgi:hypothetical protein